MKAVLTDFYPDSSPILIEEGSKVLKCSAIGRPTPEIRWNLEDPSHFQVSFIPFLIKDRSFLSLENVKVGIFYQSIRSLLLIGPISKNELLPAERIDPDFFLILPEIEHLQVTNNYN